MGKGDIKTRKGKISNGSYGKNRRKKKPATYKAPIVAKKVKEKMTEEVKEVPEKMAGKKAPAKKAATTAKKATTTSKATTAKKTTSTKAKPAAAKAKAPAKPAKKETAE